MSRKVLAAVFLLALMALPGCRPSQPSQSDWRSSAEQAITDMVSEVATSRLTVRQSLDDAFVGRSAVVVLTYAEEAAGTTVDSVSTQQPPRGARPGYDELTSALSDANDAISRARIAVTVGDDAASRESVVSLSEVLADLRRLEKRVRASR